MTFTENGGMLTMSARSFREVGWCWEGQAFDPDVGPSMFGLGDGARYLGLERANLLFNPNNDRTLTRLSDLKEVTCDISKWKFGEIPAGEGHGTAFYNWLDITPKTCLEESENLSRLSLEFPNMVAGMIDDTSCMFAHPDYSRETPAQIKAALCSANPDLKLWAVVYTTQLKEEAWQPWIDVIDVANLWIWDPYNIPHLEEYVDECRAALPGKELIMGTYMQDFTRTQATPPDLLELQFETMYRIWQEGKIDGYNILDSNMVDRHPETADWIRDWLAEH